MSIEFRQLFDDTSCTLTYLLADPQTGDAVLIDSVREHVGRYLTLLQELNLQLTWLLETHAHADHITGVAGLREVTGARSATGELSGASCADRQLADGDVIVFGNEVIRAMATPGHTAGCMTYHWRDRLFTGDTLMIGGCGRTDFQGGDAGALFDSISRIMSFPDETLIYPGHDYKGMRVSSVNQEALTNARFRNQTRDSFIELMGELKLPRPRLIDEAVPANQRCGRSEDMIDIHAA